ncbi:hypothetical protein U91I_01222 [alpha proteobacterium U9-1i]|nr:hypothetical protein U91I_01222 [alpha proteobacterium U9-1i]
MGEEMLLEVQPTVEGFQNYAALMAELYRIARRSATGADKAIDSLLKELDE